MEFVHFITTKLTSLLTLYVLDEHYLINSTGIMFWFVFCLIAILFTDALLLKIYFELKIILLLLLLLSLLFPEKCNIMSIWQVFIGH